MRWGMIGAARYAPVFGKAWMVTATFESNKEPMVWGAVNAGYHLVGNLAAAILIAAIQ